MAPTRELDQVLSEEFTRSFCLYTNKSKTNPPPRRRPKKLPPVESLQRTISDISFELAKEADHQIKLLEQQATNTSTSALPPISEVEDAKCECCGMCEECTPEYIRRVREKFMGKLICGLCSEAVKEEMGKNIGGIKKGGLEEALSEHMNACSRFNRFGRTHPVLFQAQAMKEILKRSCSARAANKSLSPREDVSQRGGIARSSSCIPAIMKDVYHSNQ